MRFTKKITCWVLIAVFMLSAFGLYAAAENICTEIEGTNLNTNDYTYYWSDTVKSYLVPTSDGFMRFQADGVNLKYLAEYYDNNFTIISRKLITRELSVFGGFYADENNFYIVSGENNPKELATVECFRVTKYDKNWNKISTASLFDCNTYIPFDAGTVRFAKSGKFLFIRTSHEMYLTNDGYHHQANVMIQVDTDAMTIVDEMTGVANVGAGYVSHSFNQFVLIDNNKIIALDHGDAYPRSAVVIKYPNEVSASGFRTWDCDYVEAIPFPGEHGDNYTGAEIGGFEYSDSNYIIAYNAVKLDDGFKSYSTNNIFITTVNKTTNNITTRKITNLTASQDRVSCPHLVKISANKFLLLWSQKGTVYYGFIDGNGVFGGIEGEIANASLSDCAPVIINGKAVWYVFTNGVTDFYEIDLNNPEVNKTYRSESGHDWAVSAPATEADPYCELECKKCHGFDYVEVCSNIGFAWSLEDQGDLELYPDDLFIEEGGRIYFLVFKKSSSATGVILPKFTLDDGTELIPVMITDDYGYLTIGKKGAYTLTAGHKYAPEVCYTVNITVGEFRTDLPQGVGDINGNGKIDARDYLLLKRAYFGTYTLTCTQETADINGNGKIDARDYLLLKRAYFGTYAIG